MTTVQKSTQIKDRILEMFNRGLTDEQMAEALVCSKGKIRYHRLSIGVTRNKTQITEENRLLIKKLHREGLKIHEIVTRTHYREATVVRVLNNADSKTCSIADVLKDPVNKLLASPWTAETVGNYLV